MKKAVIMCRVSSDEQAKGYSLDIQFENLTKHCLRNEIEIVQHYREDYSAKNFKRPEFKKFMAYARANRGKIDVLLITTWDRFSRNLTDSLIIIRQLENLGIVVNAIEQPIDMTIPENKAMLAMHLAIPEIENERRQNLESRVWRRWQCNTFVCMAYSHRCGGMFLQQIDHERIHL